MKKHRTTIKALLERDGPNCGWCGGKVDIWLKGRSQHSVSIDHEIPKSLGGSDDLSNLQLMHLGCNFDKGAYHPQAHLLVNSPAAQDYRRKQAEEWARRLAYDPFDTAVQIASENALVEYAEWLDYLRAEWSA